MTYMRHHYHYCMAWYGLTDDVLSILIERIMSKAKFGAQSHPSASTQRSHPHDLQQPGQKGVQFENTFKLEPDDTFPSAPIRKIINEILQVSQKDIHITVLMKPPMIMKYYLKLLSQKASNNYKRR